MVFNFEQVHNYYERLVFEGVAARAEFHPDFTMDMFSDVACVALNRLPAKYVRHDVDLMFYLSEPERRAIDQALDTEIQAAFKFVIERMTKNPR
ncbi:MAG: late competence development ComFB family protein [Rhodoferax sp.]|nr:late competence development ComFB family protein [Rhodoferax sp.]MCF8211753.1 late competence development ComFB family protein [Rhodoferax sp.]